MATSDTSIANRAITKLGEARILDLSDDIKAAREISSCYEAVRDALLRRYRWRFAIKRVEIAADAAAPAYGYANRFLVPNDFLRLDRVGDGYGMVSLADYRDGDLMPFQLEGRYILTDFGAPLKVRYGARIEDPAQFDACFEEAFACKLAVEVAEALTQSETKRARALMEWRLAMADAVMANAIESPPEEIADTEWTLARL